MSDSHIYELEDILWDDFSISDNLLVPYPQIQQDEGNAIQTESHKKLKHKGGMTKNTGSRAELVGIATEKTVLLSPEITSDNVITNGSGYHKPDTGQTFNDLISNLSSEGPTVTRGDFKSNNNFYNGAFNHMNNCSAPDNKSFYSLSDTTQSESDLSFLCNGHENKEIDNSLFCDWPNIGNYDLTQMLRSCDSSFGLGDLAEEDDMCWFSSPTAINGPNAAPQSQIRSSYSDFNSLKIFSENYETSQPTYESTVVDALKKRSAGASYTSSTLASNATGQSCLSKASSINELHANVAKMDEKKPSKEVNKLTRNMDYQTQSEVSHHQLDISKSTSKSFFSKASNKLRSSNCSGLQRQNFIHDGQVAGVTYSDPVPAQKKIFYSENEESLDKGSQSVGHPLEETNFLQIQEVMEQLDLKTKLCIRDSLYRLARSAEQRHGISTMNRAGEADIESNDALIAGTKQAGLLDIETDTNPIDRSIAHLLFHT